MTSTTFTFKNGNKYTYTAYDIDTQFKDAKANYMFCYQKDGKWNMAYVGQTTELGTRFADHHKMSCAKNKGATHVLVRVNNDEQARLAEEKLFIETYKPPCNEMLK